MKAAVRALLFVSTLAMPLGIAAQNSDVSYATYITSEQWNQVNTLPGVDRQLVSRDIGALNLSVGIIHRGAIAGGGGGGGGNAPPPDPDVACGVTSGPESGARGILHMHQTETYIIVSGAGTLVTGGDILNGRLSGPDSQVTTTLNGPSCSGAIVGDFVVRDVKEGDIVIIPAGTPHGWLAIPDHVDYLSVRPDPDRVLPEDYVHPEIADEIDLTQ